MTELTLLILRIGFLLLLWLFVFSVIYALRSDLFGAPVRRMKQNGDAEVGFAAAGAAAPVAYEQSVGGSTPAAPGTPVVPISPISGTGTPAGSGSPISGGLPSAGSSGPAKHLVVLSGVAAGSTIALDADIVTIGRSPDSTLVIVDEYTSTYHARLDRTDNGWSITDLDSTNGTKVAGQRISGRVALAPYTQVTIGTTNFELRP